MIVKEQEEAVMSIWEPQEDTFCTILEEQNIISLAMSVEKLFLISFYNFFLIFICQFFLY